MGELQRLAALAPNWDWSRCAVIAREWDLSMAEQKGTTVAV